MKRKVIISLCVSLMALFAAPAFAQNQTVKGTVVDENGEPIIGASVVVAGQAGSGVITDFDGNYSISVPKGGKVTISFIGYTSQTVVPGGKVQLKEDSQNLEEVVVVGYGVQKKAHLTGSVSQVSSTEIQDISTSNIASALSGLVNGLSVSGGDTRPGESASMYIRGANDLSKIGSSNQQPLFVIDGFILDATAFNNLDASSIESISVLKDAAAAVYGSRAAGGVVLVTTKKGKLGAPQISYNGTFGFTDAVATPKMLSAYNYGRLWNAVKMGNITDTDINARYDLYQADELEAMKSLNYDLLDKYWDVAMTQQHSVNISGATEKASYFANVAYFNQDGNLGKLDYDRWNFRAGADVKVGKGWKASLSVSGDYGKKNTPLMKVQSTTANKDYMMLLTHPRYVPEEINGYAMANYGISNNELQTVQDYNYGYLQNSSDYKRNMTSNIYINGSLEYDFSWNEILKGLKFKLSYSKGISQSKNNEFGTSFNVYRMAVRSGSGQHLYTPIAGEEEAYAALMDDSNFLLGHNNAAVSNGTDGGYISRNMDRSDRYQINFTATYARDFGQHHVSGLFSIEKSESEYEYLYGQGTKPYDFSTGQSNSIDTGSGGITSSEFTRTESGTLSYVGRINYSYADKYLFEFLLRSDASTKFAPENYWGVFPSASLGWIVSQEKFMEKVSWIDFLKLRASFGLTGRDNISAWQWMQTYNMTKDKGGVIGENGPAGSHIEMNNGGSVNRDVHWDKSYKANLGIDFNTLNNRLGINIDAYYVWDRDMLMPFSGSVPSTVGTKSASQNYGKMDSYGIELSATWRDKIGKDFKYKIGLNTGLSDNKVLLMDWPRSDLYRSIHYGSRTDMGTWGYQCIGMFRSFQDIEEYFEKYNITQYCGKTKDQVRPGMLIYKDIRGTLQDDGVTYGGPDGVVDSNDYVQLSNRSNPYHFTLNIGADYKNFSLTAQLNASWGGYSFVPGNALTPNDEKNSGWEVLEYLNMPSFWNPDNMFVYEDIYDGSGNLVQAANRNGNLPNMRHADVNSATSTFWRVSGTRITLNRMTLAYKVPSEICKYIGIQSCRFNVTGQNLLSLYNPYPDNFIDPMMSYGSYPALRKFTLGINVTF